LSKKQKDKVVIQFVGSNYEDVTGSMTLITYKDKTIAIDCGMYQGTSKFKTYNTNKNMFKNISVGKISDIIMTHKHLDHLGNIATLFNQGGSPKIHMVKGSKKITELMLQDSYKITTSDVDYLNKGGKNKYKYLFEERDINKVISNLFEHKYNDCFRINDYFTLEFISAGHIYLSSQVRLTIKDGNFHKVIVFGGDLGNSAIQKPLVKPVEYIKTCDLFFGETTYAATENKCTKKHRKTDLKNLKKAITSTCEKKGKVLIGSFALQRTLDILEDLYTVWEGYKFDFPIYVDSPLAKSIFDIMSNQTSDAFFGKMMSWENLVFTDSYDESKSIVGSNESCIIIASSAFAQGGRILSHFTTVLPDENSTLVTIGYSSPESNMGLLKAGKEISIVTDKKAKNYSAKCKIVELTSYSSHMQHDELLSYYSSIQTNQIVLQHGNLERKLRFAEMLDEEYKKQCKTTKIIIPNKNDRMEI